jgi:hypothetical protein
MPLTREYIASTKSTPEIVLDPDGVIIIRGRSMNPDVTDFSNRIGDWIDKYLSDPADLTSVDIYLEYINTNNFKFYISLLGKIESVKLKNKKYIFNWYYDEGDNDILEKGEYISAAVEVSFNFIMISDPFISS